MATRKELDSEVEIARSVTGLDLSLEIWGTPRKYQLGVRNPSHGGFSPVSHAMSAKDMYSSLLMLNKTVDYMNRGKVKA